MQTCKTTTKAIKHKIWKEINAVSREWGYLPESVVKKDTVVNMTSVKHKLPTTPI